jgi:hypothetical protein
MLRSRPVTSDAGLHVMTKPFSMTALASKVREILDG